MSRFHTMIKVAAVAAAPFAMAAAPLAHAGEGAYHPTSVALGFSGTPAQAAAPHAFPSYNSGEGGDTSYGRPAASVMGPAGKPVPNYAFNSGSSGNG